MRTHEKPDVISADLVWRVRRVTSMGVMDSKRVLEDASPLFYSRLMEAVLVAQEAGISEERGTFLRDPIEDEPEFSAIFEDAKRLAQTEVEDRNEEFYRTLPGTLHFLRGRGQIHLYGATLQRILRENYGIEWFTLQQMNPHIYF